MWPAWRRGGIGQDWLDPPGPRDFCYVQGGAAAYDRSRFLELGGFDPIFHPGYWEDYDLSWRALRAGWRSVYDPRAVARHVGKGSISRLLGERRLERVKERNRLWFIWLNLADPLLWLRHLVALPWIYLRDLREGRGWNLFWGFLAALAGAPKVWARRRQRKKTDPPKSLKDRDIFRKSSPRFEGARAE
jgi:GT2 family glycosyltransferase